MPQAVWSHNTTVCRAINFTPFWLLYGAEAVLPEEVKHRSLRIAMADPACPSEPKKKLVGIGQAQSRGKLEKISRRNRGMEGPNGPIVGFQCRQFGTF
jgi:hypothetical protein